MIIIVKNGLEDCLVNKKSALRSCIYVIKTLDEFSLFNQAMKHPEILTKTCQKLLEIYINKTNEIILDEQAKSINLKVLTPKVIANSVQSLWAIVKNLERLSGIDVEELTNKYKYMVDKGYNKIAAIFGGRLNHHCEKVLVTDC